MFDSLFRFPYLMCFISEYYRSLVVVSLAGFKAFPFLKNFEQVLFCWPLWVPHSYWTDHFFHRASGSFFSEWKRKSHSRKEGKKRLSDIQMEGVIFVMDGKKMMMALFACPGVFYFFLSPKVFFQFRTPPKYSSKSLQNQHALKFQISSFFSDCLRAIQTRVLKEK